MERVAAQSEWVVKRERPSVVGGVSKCREDKDNLPCSFLQSTGYYDKVGETAHACTLTALTCCICMRMTF